MNTMYTIEQFITGNTLNAEETSQQDPIMFPYHQDVAFEVIPDENTRKRHIDQPMAVASAVPPPVNNLKKVAHRNVERQRRLEMNNLYSQLSSLLPPECNKGKQSVADHMMHAANFIKSMEERIKVLNLKRDKLKKSMSSNAGVDSDIADGGPSSTKQLPNTVDIKTCQGGLEITMNTCSIEEGFPLSKVLKVLSQEGLAVLGCIYSKNNERLHHTIGAEVNDSACIDLPRLQEKLTSVINAQAISC